jgi:hypothetical protein
MPSDDWQATQRRMNGFFSMTAEVFRIAVQYGFVPFVVYLGKLIF